MLVHLWHRKQQHHLICLVERHRKRTIIIIIPQPNIFTETRTQKSFRVCGLSSCNLLAKSNSFVLCVVLLLCLVSELQKPSGLERRTVFRGCGRCSCSLLTEINNFGLGTILISYLLSEIQKPSSSRQEPRTVIRVLDVVAVISSPK
jgi:hypothetical protein